MDVIQRLEPVIIEIERERECVVVVAHQAILRALYGYFMKIPLSVRAPFLPNLSILLMTCVQHAPLPNHISKGLLDVSALFKGTSCKRLSEHHAVALLEQGLFVIKTYSGLNSPGAVWRVLGHEQIATAAMKPYSTRCSRSPVMFMRALLGSPCVLAPYKRGLASQKLASISFEGAE